MFDVLCGLPCPAVVCLLFCVASLMLCFFSVSLFPFALIVCFCHSLNRVKMATLCNPMASWVVLFSGEVNIRAVNVRSKSKQTFAARIDVVAASSAANAIGFRF